DLQKLDRRSGGFDFIDGRAFSGPNEVIIDQYYAAQKGGRAGQTINLLGRDWRVAGVIASGKLARIVFPLDVLQDLTANTGKVSQIYLKLDNPANTYAVIEALKAKMEAY